MRSNLLSRFKLLIALICVSLLIVSSLVKPPVAYADTTPQALPFTQNWSGTGLITTDDNWSGVPGIIGYRGDDATAGTGVDPQTVTQDLSAVVDVNANRSDPNTFATGGVTEFDGIADPVVALQGSGTADFPNLVITLNTTGMRNVNVAYNLRDIDGSADNAVQAVALQYRVGTSGSYTNVPAGFVSDATSGPNLATLVTPVSATLPYLADNKPTVQVRIVTTNAAGNDEWVGVDDINITGTAGTGTPVNTFSDFDGDGKADVAVWSPSSHNWYINQSSNSQQRVVIDWGNGDLGDRAVPGDYDGDSMTDFAVYRPSEGNWYILRSSTNTPIIVGWGNSTDIPVPADYDGDKKTDVAVYRPSEGNWYIIQSTTGTPVTRNWGNSTDIPVPGDYDGDGKADIAVFRASENNWYVRNSSIVTQPGTTAPGGTGSQTVRGWGLNTDRPVPRDYDGDGKTDIAVFRPSEGNWYVRNSATNTVTVQGWGVSTDLNVAADYNGDGKADIAVWRPSEGNWYILNSGGTPTPMTVTYLGGTGDVPVPSAYPPSQQP